MSNKRPDSQAVMINQNQTQKGQGTERKNIKKKDK